jgi:hypothetical protein
MEIFDEHCLANRTTGRSPTGRGSAGQGCVNSYLLREAIDKILETAPTGTQKPKKSAYGLLAKYGPGPSGAEIDQNRQEMFHGFAKEF